MKFKNYEGQKLEGCWEISFKIDGVRCQRSEKGFVSKSQKPLYNIDTEKDFEFAEIYCGSWNKTMSKVRSKNKIIPVLEEEIYPLFPTIDNRLYVGLILDPSPSLIDKCLKVAVDLGHEGLILRQGKTFYKVKKNETLDIKVIGLEEGKGRNKSKLGAFVTEMGNVGVGLSDKQRVEYFSRDLIGSVIEVKCMEITEAGKFRKPVFVRIRWDKF